MSDSSDSEDNTYGDADDTNAIQQVGDFVSMIMNQMPKDLLKRTLSYGKKATAERANSSSAANQPGPSNVSVAHGPSNFNSDSGPSYFGGQANSPQIAGPSNLAGGSGAFALSGSADPYYFSAVNGSSQLSVEAVASHPSVGSNSLPFDGANDGSPHLSAIGGAPLRTDAADPVNFPGTAQLSSAPDAANLLGEAADPSQYADTSGSSYLATFPGPSSMAGPSVSSFPNDGSGVIHTGTGPAYPIAEPYPNAEAVQYDANGAAAPTYENDDLSPYLMTGQPPNIAAYDAPHPDGVITSPQLAGNQQLVGEVQAPVEVPEQQQQPPPPAPQPPTDSPGQEANVNSGDPQGAQNNAGQGVQGVRLPSISEMPNFPLERLTVDPLRSFISEARSLFSYYQRCLSLIEASARSDFKAWDWLDACMEKMSDHPRVSDKMKLRYFLHNKDNSRTFRLIQKNFKLNLNEQYYMGKMNLLHISCDTGWTNLARELVETEEMDVNQPCPSAHMRPGNLTPLMLAAGSGHKKVVEILLRSPDLVIDQMDTEGFTALFHACNHGTNRVGDQHGYFRRLWSWDLSQEQLTAMENTARKNAREIIRLLIINGCDINARDNTGATLLYRASTVENFQSVLEFLVSVGFRVTQNVINWATVKNPDSVPMLEEEMRNPKSLVRVCRLSIWKTLREAVKADKAKLSEDDLRVLRARAVQNHRNSEPARRESSDAGELNHVEDDEQHGSSSGQDDEGRDCISGCDKNDDDCQTTPVTTSSSSTQRDYDTQGGCAGPDDDKVVSSTDNEAGQSKSASLNDRAPSEAVSGIIAGQFGTSGAADSQAGPVPGGSGQPSTSDFDPYADPVPGCSGLSSDAGPSAGGHKDQDAATLGPNFLTFQERLKFLQDTYGLPVIMIDYLNCKF